MRSWTRTAALAAALALAGCGNYSTEDLRFLAALPQREDLAFKVPAAAPPPGALSTCTTRDATVWLEAKPTSDAINGGVDLVLGLVDLVRRQPPTWRTEDARGWGPFDADDHPGRELQIVIARTYPPELAGAPAYAYAFQARWKGATDFTTVVSGAFVGGSASHGRGGIVLDFDAMIALGMRDPAEPGTMQIAYDRTSDPATIQLSLSGGGLGLVQFGYRYAGYAAGGGVFDYAYRNQAGDVFFVLTGYDAEGAGRADVGFQGAGGGSGGFRQCWGAGACLVYVLDPGNYSCAAADWPCSFGVETDCPAVPASPF
jgi:hypothetical protein